MSGTVEVLLYPVDQPGSPEDVDDAKDCGVGRRTVSSAAKELLVVKAKPRHPLLGQSRSFTAHCAQIFWDD